MLKQTRINVDIERRMIRTVRGPVRAAVAVVVYHHARRSYYLAIPESLILYGSAC